MHSNTPQRWLGRLGWVALLSTAVPVLFGFSFILPFGGSIRYQDVLMAVSAGLILPHVATSRAIWIVGAFAISGALIGWHGLADGAETRWLVRDGRPVAYMALGSVIALYLVSERETWLWGVRLAAGVLAILASLLVVNQFSSSPIIGSDTAANTLFYGDRVIELTSRRSRTEAGALSTFVLGGAFAVFISGMSISGLVGRRTTSIIVMSAVVILFLSYSRNTVLALAITGLIGIVARTGEPWVNHVLRTATIVVVSLIAAIPAVAIAAQAEPIGDAIRTFDQRVIGGLSAENRAVDTSTRWRTTETTLAWRAVEDAPLTGAGLGVFYRPSVQGEPFNDDGGKLYIHNYYLWLLVKGGVFYLIVVAGLWLWAIGRMLVQPNPFGNGQPMFLFAGAGLAGIATTSWVAPFADQTDFSALLGASVTAAIIFGGNGHRAKPPQLKPQRGAHKVL